MIFANYMMGGARIVPDIEYVSSALVSGQFLSMPAHQAGDLLIIIAHRLTNIIPGTASGWTTSGTEVTAGLGVRVAWKIAASSSETSGTWSNANFIGCIVYRHAKGIGNIASNIATSGIITYGAVTPTKAPAWFVVLYTKNSSGTTALPFDLQTRMSATATSGFDSARMTIGDTNGYQNSYPGASQSNQSAPWCSFVLELTQ